MSATERITVVGIGADGWDGLPQPHREAVAGCEVLVGGGRQLALVPDGDYRKVPLPSPLLPELDALFDAHATHRIAVLASGDPLLFGIGGTLVRRFGAHRVRILPGVSSVALARARLGWTAEETEVVTAVGRSVHRTARALAPGRRVLVLSSDAGTPDQVAELLTATGYGASSMSVLEELGGAAENRVDGTAAAWSYPPGAALNVLAIDCAGGPGLSLLAGLPDEAFEHDGQLTKRDVRAATLGRLAPRPGELLWDVGAGSGSVAVEWCRAHPANRAIAIERHPDRAARIRRNADRLGVPDIQVVDAGAPDSLDGLGEPDAVFVGGAVSAPALLARCLRAVRPGGRLVANGVTLEAEHALASAYAEHGGELVRISVEQAAPLGGFTGWTPARAVTQWSLTTPAPAMPPPATTTEGGTP